LSPAEKRLIEQLDSSTLHRSIWAQPRFTAKNTLPRVVSVLSGRVRRSFTNKSPTKGVKHGETKKMVINE
jgi:hypothetical protein